MADSGAVAVREDSSQRLTDDLERRRSEARTLELKVSRREAELRRAKEERALLAELRTMNEMILKKKQRQEGVTEGRLKISPESLAELRALEDELKLEDKRTAELQDAAKVTSHQLEEVERSLEEKSSVLAIAKRATGWDVDVNSARSASSAYNEFLERKKVLTQLNEEQNTVRSQTDRLTREIEELARVLDEQQALDEKIAAAKESLAQQDVEYQEAVQQMKSYERLRKKKERILDGQRTVDEYKPIRQLEGDKRVLHSNLSALRENNVSNSKSILSLEVRLRQLETRLEAVNLFLKQVFAEVEDDEPMPDVPEDAIEVPLAQFEALCQQLEKSRETVMQRDDQLENHDAKVEQLEQKVAILQNAITSRKVSSQLHVREKEREFETLMSHVDGMKREFEEEQQRLKAENAALRQKIQQRGSGRRVL